MSTFDVIIATKDGTPKQVNDAMKLYEGTEWSWFQFGGRGWEPYAYVDIDGYWHAQYGQGDLIPLDEWRTKLWTWMTENQQQRNRLTIVRCKG